MVISKSTGLEYNRKQALLFLKKRSKKLSFVAGVFSNNARGSRHA
jgi:hypothetical protein